MNHTEIEQEGFQSLFLWIHRESDFLFVLWRTCSRRYANTVSLAAAVTLMSIRSRVWVNCPFRCDFQCRTLPAVMDGAVMWLVDMCAASHHQLPAVWWFESSVAPLYVELNISLSAEHSETFHQFIFLLCCFASFTLRHKHMLVTCRLENWNQQPHDPLWWRRARFCSIGSDCWM